MQRQTKQREAIAACFASAGRPLSPHEVHALACEVQPSLGIATVYRALNAFVEDGLLVRVPIGGATRYELAAERHHHHFHCQECDRAFPIERSPIPAKVLAPEGFAVRTHDLVVSGACPECASDHGVAQDSVSKRGGRR
jgi:Fur family ferric uptake transcriptional regulator